VLDNVLFSGGMEHSALWLVEREKKDRRTCWKIYDGEKATIEWSRGVDLGWGVEVVTTWHSVAAQKRAITHTLGFLLV
jgi:hypothetical protein